MIGADDLTVRHVSSEQLPELRAVLRLACGKASLLFHRETLWNSVTFTGKRHTIALEFNGGDAVAYAEAFIGCLPHQELVIPGKLLADAAIVHVSRENAPAPRWTVTLQLLVLDDTGTGGAHAR